MVTDKEFHDDGCQEVLDAMIQAAFPPDMCVIDRRENGPDQRQIPVAVERHCGTGRREQRKERRRRIDPTTCARDYNDDEIEFMKAMDQYKRDHGRPFPTWIEVLEVLRALRYRKVAEPKQMPGLSTTLPPKVEAQITFGGRV